MCVDTQSSDSAYRRSTLFLSSIISAKSISIPYCFIAAAFIDGFINSTASQVKRAKLFNSHFNSKLQLFSIWLALLAL